MGKFTKKMADYLEEKFPNHIILGDRALAAKNFEKAIEHYTKVAEKKDLNEFVCFNWGTALVGLGRLEEAVEQFKQSIEFNAEFYDSYIQWGLTLYKMEKFKEAEEVYKKIEEKEPEFPPLYFHWAIVKEALEQPDEAIKLYEKSVEITPTDVLSINAIGKICFDKEDYDKAMDQFQKAIKVNQKFAPSYLNIALVQSRRGITASVISQLKKAIELDPTAKMVAQRSEEFKKYADNEQFQELLE